MNMIPHVLILVPTDVERTYFKDSLLHLKSQIHFTAKVVATGIGKINAAQYTALETQSDYDLIVSSGYCGADDTFEVGEVAVPASVVDYRLRDTVHRLPFIDKEVVWKVDVSKGLNSGITMYSADTWVDSNNFKEINTTGRSVFDMESFSVMAVSAEVGTPGVVLKVVSNIVTEEGNSQANEDAPKYLTNFDPLVYTLDDYIVNHFNN